MGMFVPGCARGTDRSFWLCPLLVADKMQFKEFAFVSGVAVFRGATQVKVVPEPDDDFKKQNPCYRGNPQSRWLVKHVCYVPVNPFQSSSDIKILANRLSDISTRYLMYL